MDKELNIKVDDSNSINFNENRGVVIIRGQTGAGKSTLINSLIIHAAEAYSPEELEIDYIDMKNVEAYLYVSYCDIPHTHKVIGTVDTKLGVKELNSIVNELSNRSMSSDKEFPMRLIIIDEYQQMGDINTHIDYIAENGPKNGMFLVLASQSYIPSARILEDAKTRLVLKCNEELSELLLDSTEASSLDSCGWVILKQREASVKAEVKFYDIDTLQAKARNLRKQYRNSQHSIIYKKEY